MLLKSIRLGLYFLVGVLLSAVACFSYAETIPATYSTSIAASIKYYFSSVGYDSPELACQAMFVGKAPWIYAGLGAMNGTTRQYCLGKTSATGATSNYGQIAYYGKCPSDGAYTDGKLTCTGYVCPTGQGWTLSGQTCTRPDCPEGSERGFDGVCLPPVDPCPVGNISSASWYSGKFDIGAYPLSSGTLRSYPSSLCDGKCSGTPVMGDSLVDSCPGSNSGSPSNPVPIVCTIQIKLTGAKCTGGNGAAPTFCPTGQTIIGTVSGMPVCGKDGVPSETPKTTESGKGTETETKTDSDGDGTPDKTESSGESTKQTTTCVGDLCTTTKVEKTTNPDGTTSEKTTTSTESKASYCETNPNSEQCKSEDDEIKPGDGAPTTELYTKGDRTAAQSFSEFGSKVQGAGFFSAATNFFTVNVPGGSCSDMSLSFNVMGGSWDVDMTPIFCGSAANAVYSVIGIGVMLAALWVAFSIAFL